MRTKNSDISKYVFLQLTSILSLFLGFSLLIAAHSQYYLKLQKLDDNLVTGAKYQRLLIKNYLLHITSLLASSSEAPDLPTGTLKKNHHHISNRIQDNFSAFTNGGFLHISDQARVEISIHKQLKQEKSPLLAEAKMHWQTLYNRSSELLAERRTASTNMHHFASLSALAEQSDQSQSQLIRYYQTIVESRRIRTHQRQINAVLTLLLLFAGAIIYVRYRITTPLINATKSLINFKYVINQAKEGVAILTSGLDGQEPKFLYTNQAFESLSQFDGLEHENLSLTSAHTRFKGVFNIDTINEAIANKGHYRGETVLITPRGGKKWLAFDIFPIFDAEGNRINLAVIESDISIIRSENLILEHQADALAKAKDEAIQASVLKSEFLANVSHELRTPMNAILGFSRQCMQNIDRWNKDHQLEHLSYIQDSGKRLLHLVNNLLDLSKLESERSNFHLAPQLINPVIQKSITECSALLEEKGMHVETRGLDRPVLITIDSQKITQVMVNLLGNAIKFSEYGSAIVIECVVQSTPYAMLELLVIDQGFGIPEDEFESIFDPFVQSSQTNTGAGGTGLGLSICKEIIEGHQGQIIAKENPEGGSILHLTLPMFHDELKTQQGHPE